MFIPAIIVDLDGTLCDNSHRIHYLNSSPKDWANWNAHAHLDKPIEPMVQLLDSIYNQYQIIICTGREEILRKVTEEWLDEHNVPWTKLYMRKMRDYRDDPIVKSELLEQILADGYRPNLVFEDRSRVVKMWRERGLLCCQVAEGNF